MSRGAVADNYASTLLELALREDQVERYGELLAEVAELYLHDEEFRLFLATPRVSAAEKKEALRASLEGRAPQPFVHFLMVVLDKGRHRALPAIRERYRDMVDERENRVHATVTLVEEPDRELREEIQRRLADVLGREVVPHFRVKEELLGGVVIRVGDHMMDASLRRRLDELRRELLKRQEAAPA